MTSAYNYGAYYLQRNIRFVRASLDKCNVCVSWSDSNFIIGPGPGELFEFRKQGWNITREKILARREVGPRGWPSPKPMS